LVRCSAFVGAGRYGKRRITRSFNHGWPTDAMLQAIGAHATHPDRQVISMSGDAVSA